MFWVVVCLALATVESEQALVEPLGAAIIAKRSSYHDLAFKLRVDRKDRTFPKERVSYDELRIMSPLKDEAMPWRAWIQRLSNDDNAPIEAAIYFRPGKQVVFERNPRESTGKMEYHKGFIATWYPWKMFDENRLNGALFDALNGTIKEIADSRMKYDYSLQSQSSKSNTTRYRFLAKSRGPSFSREMELEVLGNPVFVVEKRYFSVPSNPGYFLKLDITDVGEFEGTFYPKVGRYEESPPEGSTVGSDFKFEVLSVSRLAEADRESWIPEFPPGTLVSDKIKGKSYLIPRDENEQLEGVLAKMRSCRKRWSAGRIAIYAFNIGVVALLVVLAVRQGRGRA